MLFKTSYPRGTAKPATGARINYGHSLARGIQVALLLNDCPSMKLTNVADFSNPAANQFTLPSWTQVREGNAIFANQGANGSGFSLNKAVVGVGSKQVSVWARATGSPNNSGGN